MTTSDSLDPAVFDFLDQFLADLDAGRTVPLSEYLRRFPGHEEAIVREYLAVRTSRGAGAGSSSAIEAPRPRERILHYRLIRKLGRGGQGSVMLAEDERLPRRVALKILDWPLELLSDRKLDRFRREAEAVGQLNHPGICTVFEAQFEQEPPYIAMRFVSGQPLADWIRFVKTEDEGESPPLPLGPESLGEVHRILHFFEQASIALHAAHEAGVVHRDVKPGNIMVTPEAEPVILDFGLARIERADAATLTGSGEIFGTPAYMSPEQLQGKPGQDRRTDIYSLAVALYECLTLQRPFISDSRESLFRAIQMEEAPSPSSLNAAVPQDLSTVLEKALSKEQSRRYRTAFDFAEDLRRVRERKPVKARPAGPWLKSRRWIQRHPVASTAGIGTALILATGLVIVSAALAEVQRERDIKDRALITQRVLRVASMSERMVRDDTTVAFLLTLEAARRDQGEHPNILNTAILRTMRASREEWFIGSPPGAMIQDYAVSPRDRVLAIADETGRITLCDYIEKKSLVSRSLSEHALQRVEFNRDGTILAAISASSELIFMNGSDLSVSGTPQRLGGIVTWCHFSPTQDVLAICFEEGHIELWDASRRKLHERLEGHEGPVNQARFDPSGAYLISTSGHGYHEIARSDRSARIWSVADGEQLQCLRGHLQLLFGANFHPDRRIVVTSSNDRSLRVWNAENGRELWRKRFPGRVFTAEFSPDGSQLVAGFDPGEDLLSTGLQIYDTNTGEILFDLDGHEHRSVTCARFSPDGRYLASCSYDGTVRVWQAINGHLLWTFKQRRERFHIHALSWSPDGTRLIAQAEKGEAVRVWRIGEHPLLRVFRGQDGPALCTGFDSSGEHVLVAYENGTVIVWNRNTGIREAILASHQAPVRFAEFHSNGRWVLTGSDDGTACVWDWRSQTLVHELHGHADELIHAEFTPNGRQVLTASKDGSVRFWDLEFGKTLLDIPGDGWSATCVSLSADQARVAIGNSQRTVRLFDARSGERLGTMNEFVRGNQDENSIFDVAFHPAGEIMAIASQDNRVRIWEWRSNRIQSVFNGPNVGVLQFNAQGKELTATYKWGPGQMTLDIDGWGIRDRRFVHTNKLAHSEYDPKGLYVVSASYDGTAKIWDSRQRREHATLIGHEGPLTDAAFSPDSHWVVTTSVDGTARLWPVHPQTWAQYQKPRELTEFELEEFF